MSFKEKLDGLDITVAIYFIRNICEKLMSNLILLFEVRVLIATCRKIYLHINNWMQHQVHPLLS